MKPSVFWTAPFRRWKMSRVEFRQICMNKFKLAFILGLCAARVGAHETSTEPQDELLLGQAGKTKSGEIILPVSQMLKPAGVQVELPGLRPQVIALSPDGKLLATSGKTRELVLVDPATSAIRQKVPLPGEQPVESAAVSSHILKPDKNEQVSYTGLVFSPDGSRLYLSNVRGSIKVFAVDAKHNVTGLGALPLPHANAPERKEEIPSGLAISQDGRRLYVAGSMSDHV